MEHNYNKGSEWRKWDLHIHTPSSIEQKYGDKFDQFIDALERLPKEVKVIGITDYYFIDGYEKVMGYKKNGRLANIDKIFPILEFRIDTFGSGNENKLQKINLHILFDVDESNLAQEINKIKTEFIGLIPISTLEEHRTKMLSIQNFIDAGGNDLKRGFESMIPHTEKVFEIIRSKTWINKTFLFAGYKEWSNLAKNQQLKPIKQKLYNDVDAFLSASPKESFLGCQTWLNEFGTKKLLQSRDIHSFDVLDTANKNHAGEYIDSTKYYCDTWIKADATFEGLKQIISEPEERVRIQDSNPNNEKRLYNVIEKVILIDKSGKKRFSTQEIGFNPNLNAIIGGKSSGKSLLMHMIAKELGNITDNKDYSEILTDVEIEVFYADNIEEKSSAEDKRIVEFLPQLHIEKIVRNKSETRKSIDGSTRYFNKFIEDLIRQNENINRCFTSHQEIIKQATARINESITKWMEFDKDFTREKKELQPLGDKTAINGEIKRINEQIKLITENTGLTEIELVQYTQLTGSNKYNVLVVSRLNEELSELRRLFHYANKDVLQQIKQSLSFKTNTPTTLALYDKFVSELPEVIQPKIDSFIAEVNSKGKEIVSSIEEIKKTISENNKLLKPLLDKNKLQEEIKLLENKLTSEKKKITDIENKEATINDIKNNRDTIDLIEDYTLIVNSYAALKDNITSSMAVQWENSKANLTLSANSIFDSSMFTNTIGTVINIRSYLETQFAGCGFNSSEYKFINENHISNIQSIWEKCTADENRFDNFKGYGNTEKLLRAIFEDCFYIDYDIKKGNDSLQKMSEGKKGIVILQLYLSLSKADCPILIDQPEDNLDNRTVYIELNDYIKSSKQKRQIIMVSHNANLVVNTDAENVIVANQSGEDGKENKEFQFEYVNGALENTSPLDLGQNGILYQQGIREHVCEVLEGGTEAFKKREEKYHIK